MKFYITKPGMAIFIDESNKDREVARRKYGWFPTWIRVDCKPLFDIDSRYIPACETVLHKYNEKDEHKHLNIERFVGWTLVPILGNFSQGESHSMVII